MVTLSDISPREVCVVLMAACGACLALRMGPRVGRVVWALLLTGGIVNALVLNLQSYNLIQPNLSHYYLGAKYSFAYDDFYRLFQAALEKPQIGMTDLSNPPRTIRPTPTEQRAYYIDLLREEGTRFDPEASLATLAFLARETGAVRREAQRILAGGLPPDQIDGFRRDVAFAAASWPGRVLTRDYGFNGSPFYVLVRHVDPTLYGTFGRATALLNLGWQIIAVLVVAWFIGVALGVDLAGRMAMGALVFASWDFTSYAFPGLVCAGLFLPLAAAIVSFRRRANVHAGIAIAWAGLIKLFPFVLLLPAFMRLIRAVAFVRRDPKSGRLRPWLQLLLACGLATAAGVIASSFGGHSWGDFFGKIVSQFGGGEAAGNNVSVSRLLSIAGIGGFWPAAYAALVLVGLAIVFVRGSDEDFYIAMPRRALVLFAAVAWIAQNWLNYYSIGMFLLLPLLANRHRVGAVATALAMAGSFGLPDFDDPRLAQDPWLLALKLAPYVMVPAWLVVLELRAVLSKRAQRVGLLVCAVLLAGTALEAWRVATVRRLGSEAYLFVVRGDGAGAAPVYRRLLKLSPRNDAVHNGLAVALAMSGDVPGAESNFVRAIRLKPEDVGARRNYARLLAQLQRVDEAVDQLEEARTFEPHNATVLFELARLRLLQGRNTDALPLLQRAHELEPDNREIREAWSRFTR